MLPQDRGTLLRIELISGIEKTIIDTLEVGAAGLVFDSTTASTIFGSVSSVASDSMLIDGTGQPIPFSDSLDLLETIRGFVIYPDGSIWEGTVVDNTENLAGFFWGSSLLRSMKDEKVYTSLFKKDDWAEIPTSILVFRDGIEKGCARVEHTCGKQCD